jgi:nucleoside-diphosphate-sugar epimerase
MRDKNTPGNTIVITGAFSYTGKYGTRILLSRGYRIRTLTHHPKRANPFGDEVRVFPYDFDHPDLDQNPILSARR